MTIEPFIADKWNCFCGSETAFDICCKPLLTEAAYAETAEQLMRSRYSAFCTKNDLYLVRTLHPSQRQKNGQQSLDDSIAHKHWISLTLISTSHGKKTDDTGTVEFIAQYEYKGSFHQHHELSTFVKEDAQWFYVSGEYYEPSKMLQLKFGRNTPCWCGSGKKYKKCHG